MVTLLSMIVEQAVLLLAAAAAPVLLEKVQVVCLTNLGRLAKTTGIMIEMLHKKSMMVLNDLILKTVFV